MANRFMTWNETAARHLRAIGFRLNEPARTPPDSAALVDMNSEACRGEIRDYLAGLSGARLDDVYWFARLAAHFATDSITTR